MKRRFLVLFFCLAAVAGLIFLTQANKAGKRQARVCFENNCFYAELAYTPEEKERGLMFRKELAQNRGMLFVFDQEGEYSFWMKNTLIPLDIIWLNENREVVFMAKNNMPCLSEDCPIINPSGKKAKYVLELNDGMIEKIGLNLGNKMNVHF